VRYDYAATGNLVGLNSQDVNLSLTYDRDLLTGWAWSGTVTGRVPRRVIERTVNGAQVINFTYDGDRLRTQAGALSIDRAADHGRVTGTVQADITGSRSFNGFVGGLYD